MSPPSHIALHVTPKSSKSEVIGWMSDADGRPVLKVRICATPEDGKANRELVKFLARHWGVPAAALEVARGTQSRYKLLKIDNKELLARLLTEATSR